MKSTTPIAAPQSECNRNNSFKTTDKIHSSIIGRLKRYISTINQFTPPPDKSTKKFFDDFETPTAANSKLLWRKDCGNEYGEVSNEPLQTTDLGFGQSIREAIQEILNLKAARAEHFSPLSHLRSIMAIQDGQVGNLASELYKFSRSEVIAGHWDSESFPALILLNLILDGYSENLLILLKSNDNTVSEFESIRNITAEHVAEAARLLSLFCWVRFEEPPPIAWKMLALARDLTGNCYHSTEKISEKFSDNLEKKAALTSIVSTILLSLADPYSMKASDIYSANLIISQHIPSLLIRTLGIEGKVYFDLLSGSAVAGSDGKFSHHSDIPRHVIQLSVIDIATSILAYAAGEECQGKENEATLARRIVRRWLAFEAPRYSLRDKVNIRSSFVCGIDSIIRINRKNSPYSIASKSLSVEISPEACFVRDFSSRGCGIHLRGKGRLGLTSGLLAEIDLPLKKGRAVGVVKWVRRSGKNSTDIGIGILAKRFETVPFRLENARWQGGSSVEFGLLARDILCDNSADHYQMEIILPHNKIPTEFTSQLKLHAVDSGEEFTIQKPLMIGQDFILLRVKKAKY